MKTIVKDVASCSCGWSGSDIDCQTKTFGAYCGPPNDWEAWGWEEWNDLACPECGEAVTISELETNDK